MAMIKFEEKDLLFGKVVTPAWYRMRIIDVGEAPAKDQTKGPSTNYPVEGEILFNVDDLTTEFQGVHIMWNFNSKAIGFAKGFLEAFGVEVEAKRYDLAAGKGKVVDVYVENGTWNGRLVNRVEHKYRKPDLSIQPV